MGAVGRGRWGEGVERGERRLYRRMVARRRKVALGKIVGGYRETEEGLTVQDAERVEGKEREREGEGERESGRQADRQRHTETETRCKTGERDRMIVRDREMGRLIVQYRERGRLIVQYREWGRLIVKDRESGTFLVQDARQGEGEIHGARQRERATDCVRQGEGEIAGARCKTERGRDCWCKMQDRERERFMVQGSARGRLIV